MRGLIAVVAIVGVVAGVIFVGKSNATQPQGQPQTQTGSSAAAGQAPIVAVPPAKVVIECEEYLTISDKGPDGSTVMKVGQQTEGKLVKFVELPDGWMKKCGVDDLKSTPDKMPGFATYEFEIPRDDIYYLNLRARWFDSCGNSVWLKIDDKPYFYIEDEKGKDAKADVYTWAWHPYFVGGQRKELDLNAGKHKFEIRTREDGPKLDQVLITTEASTPVGDAVKK